MMAIQEISPIQRPPSGPSPPYVVTSDGQVIHGNRRFALHGELDVLHVHVHRHIHTLESRRPGAAALKWDTWSLENSREWVVRLPRFPSFPKISNYRSYVYIIIHIHTYITLHYITLHYITLHYTTLHYITLHYITYIHIYTIYTIYTYIFQKCSQELCTPLYKWTSMDIYVPAQI